MTNIKDHYDEKYFEWESSSTGTFAGDMHIPRFQPYIKPTDRVVDFGCGGGYLLAKLRCSERLGVDINPAARAAASKLGLRMVATADDVPDGWADVIISDNALEHIEAPLDMIRALVKKLRPGGTLVATVPHETMTRKWDREDVNQHLYTWSQTAFGNMLAAAGLQVQEVKQLKSMWPPYIYPTIYAIGGRRGLDLTSRVYRAFRVVFAPLWPTDTDGEVMGVAVRPTPSV